MSGFKTSSPSFSGHMANVRVPGVSVCWAGVGAFPTGSDGPKAARSLEALVAPAQALPEAAVLTAVPLLASVCRFINARRRILQPMLDSSCSETPKTKKKTAQNRPVQRFWPDSIASGAAQPPSGDLAMSEGTGWPRARTHGNTAGR